MELLPSELRRQLPPIRKIHNPAAEGLAMVYAKLLTHDTGVTMGCLSALRVPAPPLQANAYFH